MSSFIRYLVLIFPVMLLGFEPHPVTPYPVVGYEEVPFQDNVQQMSRNLLIWYPINPQLEGTISKNPWDVFNVAIGVPPKTFEAKMPVIVISHGYGGTPHQLSWLIRRLVYSGYIVLGIQHLDLSNHGNNWQRPQDISTIIDRFTAHPMANYANLNQIGIAGFSIGGTTAIWLAGGRATKLDHIVPGPKDAYPEEFSGVEATLPYLNMKMMSKSWHDPRIKAVFAMAPAWGWVFDEKSLSKISIPTYLIASSADNVLVTQSNAGFFVRNIPKSIYQEIPGKATHYVFISALNEKQQQKLSLPAKLSYLLEDNVSIDRAWIQSEVAQEATRFFNSLFKTQTGL
jgi:predicted dienelactone hydrolase